MHYFFPFCYPMSHIRFAYCYIVFVLPKTDQGRPFYLVVPLSQNYIHKNKHGYSERYTEAVLLRVSLSRGGAYEEPYASSTSFLYFSKIPLRFSFCAAVTRPYRSVSTGRTLDQ